MDRLQSYIKWISEDPISFLVYAVYFAAAVLVSLILHECAHGYAALYCGDTTAKDSGRLSLLPSHHLDPLGTMFMVLFGIGWAKPVPVNPNNYRNRRKGDFLVSIAGIATNFLLFLVSAIISAILTKVMWQSEFLDAFKYTFGGLSGLINPFAKAGSQYAICVMEGVSYDILSDACKYPWLLYVQRFFIMMCQINLSLAVFNILPIPPLDGYHLLFDVVLADKFGIRLGKKAFYIAQGVLLILCFTGLLNKVISFACSEIWGAISALLL